MSADLRSNTMFSRSSLVVMGDCLVKLEHARTHDRVRKFMFDGIEAVLIWKKLPWARLLVCLLLLALPGVALLFLQETVLIVMGVVLIAIGTALCLVYVYCGNTTIRIVRDGQPYDINGIFRPGRLRRFRERLITGIRTAQAQTTTAPLPTPPESNGSRN